MKFFLNSEVIVGVNGTVTASFVKPFEYRNSEFDETFLLKLSHTNLPEGRKLKITIEEMVPKQ